MPAASQPAASRPAVVCCAGRRLQATLPPPAGQYLLLSALRVRVRGWLVPRRLEV